MTLQPAERLLEPAVEATLSALELKDEDLALSRLAVRYARELDQAAAVAAQADRVLRAVSDDPELSELVSALKGKLSARSAVEQIGPKLQNALDALGATPKSRGNIMKEEPRGASRLQAFREKAGPKGA